MDRMKENAGNRYELRKAAGMYLLLDLRQSGEHYRPPLAMNEMGAEIFRYWHEGDNEEEIAGKIGSSYDADADTIKRDVTSFLERLKKYEAE